VDASIYSKCLEKAIIFSRSKRSPKIRNRLVFCAITAPLVVSQQVPNRHHFQHPDRRKRNCSFL